MNTTKDPRANGYFVSIDVALPPYEWQLRPPNPAELSQLQKADLLRAEDELDKLTGWVKNIEARQVYNNRVAALRDTLQGNVYPPTPTKANDTDRPDPKPLVPDAFASVLPAAHGAKGVRAW